MKLGYCHCGCGQKTNLARQDNPKLGHVKGRPYRFVRHHGRRKSPVDYTIEDRGFSTPCWIWRLQIGRGGYPQKSIGGKTQLAHRVFYEARVGPIPEGFQLDHLCRNRACVNPEHLEPVPGVVNVRRQSNVKLTMDGARAIRRSGMTSTALARVHGVSARTIREVREERTWKERA
jgi:hypothetical protein